MAYMNQERKAIINKALKPILAKYGIKGTLSVRHHSSIVLTLKSGKIDFIANSNRVCGSSPWQVHKGWRPNTSGYSDVNVYWFQDHYDGDAKDFLTEAMRQVAESLGGTFTYDGTDGRGLVNARIVF